MTTIERFDILFDSVEILGHFERDSELNHTDGSYVQDNYCATFRPESLQESHRLLYWFYKYGEKGVCHEASAVFMTTTPDC